MAITESGLYGLSVQKYFVASGAGSLEAEDNELALVLDAYTPNFDTHDFAADLTNEHSGGNYGREAVTTTEITLASGTLTFDAADTVFDNGGSNDVTITDAMACVLIDDVTTDADSPVILLLDFVTAASSTASTFTVQYNASGLLTLAYTAS